VKQIEANNAELDLQYTATLFSLSDSVNKTFVYISSIPHLYLVYTSSMSHQYLVQTKIQVK